MDRVNTLAGRRQYTDLLGRENLGNVDLAKTFSKFECNGAEMKQRVRAATLERCIMEQSKPEQSPDQPRQQ